MHRPARRPAGRPAGRIARFARRQRLAFAGGVLLAALALAAIMAPLITGALGIDPDAVDLFSRAAPPGPGHPLGTDELGRDLLARLLEGGRVSLAVGLAGALIAAVIGAAIGLVSGWAGGRTDSILMRLTDAVIALPLLPLLIVLAAIDLAKLGLPPALAEGEAAGVWRIVAIVALFGWTTVARLVRGAVLAARTRDYVLAARALGVPPRRIVLRHVLPDVAAPLIVATTLSIGNVMLTESVLSFLGLGIQPPVPSWGNMLAGAQASMMTAPHLALWPGLLIFATVMAFNLLGDGLQAELDPRAESE